ncbi:MAG: hypothetical protein HFJ82_07340 [Alistipes sp.]|nr:hypothetical protein [Alistipes sp.]
MLDFDLAAMYRVETAIQVNIAVMRAFVAIRQVLTIPPADRIGRPETQMLELSENSCVAPPTYFTAWIRAAPIPARRQGGASTRRRHRIRWGSRRRESHS